MEQIFGLLGHPLGHSFSPRIQELFGVRDYQLFDLPEDKLQSFLSERGFSGLNVTMPYKKAVIPFLDQLDPVAVQTGSVNCIVNRDGQLTGYNTDCYGFAFLMRSTGIRVFQKNCTVIGTGGVSSSIESVLYDQGAKSVRFLSHAQNNPDCLPAFAKTDVIVNASPVGMHPDTEDSPLDYAYFPLLESYIDVIFNPVRTKAVQDAAKRGIVSSGGLPMLVGQARRSAELFLHQSISDECMADVLSTITREITNIVLIGMPGCGKTTIGKELAELLHRPFYDCDQEIERISGMTVPQLFASKGESVFRDYETSALRNLCAMHGIVLATGGGCVTRPENRRLLRQNGFCVYLQAPLDALELKGRPLSKDRYTVLRLFNQRHPIYDNWADDRLERNAQPKQTAEELAKRFVRFCSGQQKSD